ncbi:related to STU1 - mitotic spindle protein [Fusarium torulosum]|uniref:Related to STU1 - mitotic spindle protein n=1 Tax=Fusarium torulosum TaxID=33205 RepID=A0AAE8SCB3_9HYPO|nr:related to STU1 - mitotic spindle protein [Fusarium torulosum]
MADTKLTDQQVADLTTILRGDGPLDSKVQYVTLIKSGIKQHNVPETSVPQLFDGLRAATTSQHAALVNAGFTALNHLLTRLSRQEPKLISKEVARTLPIVVEKLGDHKDKFRSLASHSLVTLYGIAPLDVERFVRNTAMTGKNPRAKETSMLWLLQMHKENGLAFRAYVPVLMELLEDADGMVRDTAKSTVMELFQSASNAAKSDLKRQLKTFKVRPAIEQAIVASLAPASVRPITPAAETAPAPRPALSASTSSIVDRPITPGVDTKPEALEPLYVNTNRELDDMIKEMAWCFEGKETEHNWLKRENAVHKLRRLNVGNASDFPDTYILGIKSILDGIIKSITSLRTSLCKEGCGLIQEVANSYGPGMDPLVELLMQCFVKLAAGTKKISSQLANVTVDILLSNVSYTPRLMQHIWMACQDKNVAPRTYATGWLKTILKKEAQHKAHLEHTGGVDLIEKCIKKGLVDANPAVRERTRSTFWTFWGLWPTKADAIMADLDGTAQKLLNKDPSNPNSQKQAEPAAAAATRPGMGLSKSTMGTSKPSIREAMMAQRKANAAKNLPARPGSAMANLSPMKTTTSSTSSAASKPSGTRARPETGGMSGAPMRPARRRPEMAARPATAGPYSVRDLDAGSPESIRSKNVTPKARDTTPKRTGPRTRPGHAPHASESSLASPTSIKAGLKPAASPRTSPTKLKQSQSTMLPLSSPSRANEDITLMIPSMANLKAVQKPVVEPQRAFSVPPEAAEELVTPVTESAPQLAPAAIIKAAPKTEPEDEVAPEPVVEPAPEHTDQRMDEVEPAESAEPVEPAELAESTEPVESAVAVPEPADEPRAVPAESMHVDPVQEVPATTLQVYEDPFTDDQPAPKPTFNLPVLEDKPVNADAAPMPSARSQSPVTQDVESSERTRQSSRLLESGITRIKAKTLDVHGFRKLQSLLRDSKGIFTDDKFEALLIGLFQYLEDPLPGVNQEKAQDVKAQILATIRLLLRKERDNFQPHVSRGLESLLETRSAYDMRAHIVSGVEVLADELVTIGDGSEIVVVLTKRLQSVESSAPEGSRILSTGMHVLRTMLDKRPNFVPTDTELGQLAALAGRCLVSTDSGVRMDAVQLCVVLHSRVGEQVFWNALKDVQDDPKSLITYYIVKRQREQAPTIVA